LGDTITVKVLAVNEEKGFIRVGRKQIEKDPFVEFQNTHKEGDLVSGKVIAVRDRYAVIELADGVKGVLLANDYSWSTKVRSLKTEIKVGEIVKGKIINFDTEKRLVRIGIKQLLPDPWENIEKRYKRGQIIRGRVNTITDRAIFVSIMEGVEGVVPRDEVSWNEEEPNLRKMFSKGQMVEALIVKINKERRLLYLSIKRLEGNPWQRFKEMNPKGSVVEGVVSEVRDDRIIVDLGSGVTGYFLASNASMERGIVLSEKFKVGDPVKAVVVRVVPEEKIVELSIKAYEKKLIDEAKKDFVVSEPTEVKKGTIADLLKLKGINVVSSTPKGEKKEAKRGRKKSSE
jgi:ribosomal protein S1